MREGVSLAALRAAFAEPGPEVELPDAADLEGIQLAVDGQLPRRQLAALANRVANEPGLALTWILAFELRRQLPPALAPPPPPARSCAWPRSRAALAGLALAASIILAVLVPQHSLRVTRSRPESGISTPLADGAALPRAHFELLWRPAFERARYDVDVLDEDLRAIYRVQGIRETVLVVPTETLAGVPSGGIVLWRVEALAPNGDSVLSPTFVQRLE